MKKTIYLISLFIVLLGYSSCNNDNESLGLDIPREPKQNEIKLIYNSTAENPEAMFYISGDDFRIDWGDGKISTAKDLSKNNLFKHLYSKSREYIITISTNGSIDYFKNFSADNIYEYQEEKVSDFESISIGQSVKIDKLYLQANGVKKVDINDQENVSETYILLGDQSWDLSMISASNLLIYAPHNLNLDIKNINVKRILLNIKNTLNLFAISESPSMETIEVATNYPDTGTITELSITNLNSLKHLRIYSIKGDKANLTELPRLESTKLTNFHYKTLDMNASHYTSPRNMTFQAEKISITKVINLHPALTEISIKNNQFDAENDIKELDLRPCSKLKSLEIRHLKTLSTIAFSEQNQNLEEVILNQVPKLKSLDASKLVNLKRLQVLQAPVFSTAIFSEENLYLAYLNFESTSFSATDYIELVNSLPKSHIPNIPTVNRRRFYVIGNTPSLEDNKEVLNAIETLDKFYSVLISDK